MTLCDDEAAKPNWTDDTAPFCVDEEETKVDPHELDALIAKELARLSMTDRENLLCEIHGVASKTIETPQMIEESLRQLQKEIDAIHPKLAFQQARDLDPSYVQDPNFLIKFLRAKRFDHSVAAKDVVDFFELKLELFGASLLVTDITQEHLDQDDLYGLYKGMGMDLPFRDRAGRLVFFQLAQPFTIPLRATLRKTFYALSSLSDDIETQKNGFVFVSYTVGQHLPWYQLRQRRELNRGWVKLNSIPIRMEVLHVCTDASLWRAIISVFLFATTTWARTRLREHIGDHKHVIASLKAYGIPTHGFPVTEDGTILRHLCSDRWKKRRWQEQMRKQRRTQQNLQEQRADTAKQKLHDILKRVETPGQKDVLLGRGKLYYCHPGNRRLKRIVSQQIELYEEAGYAEKYKVSAEVVKLIQSESGRFLREDGNNWVGGSR
jgi:hypothetical protein